MMTEPMVGNIIVLKTGDRVPTGVRILKYQGKTCPMQRCIAISRFLADRTSLFPCSTSIDFASYSVLHPKIIEKKYYVGENMRLCIITGKKNRKLIKLKSYNVTPNVPFISFFSF